MSYPLSMDLLCVFFGVNILNIFSDFLSSILLQEKGVDIYTIIFIRHIIQYLGSVFYLTYLGQQKKHFCQIFSIPFFTQGLVLWLAFYLWDFGLIYSSIVSVALVSFTIPLWTLLLCRIFLKEKLEFKIFFYNTISVFMIIFFLSFDPLFSQILDRYFLFLILGAFLFALMDILQKKCFLHYHYTVSETIAGQSFWVLVLNFLMQRQNHFFFLKKIEFFHLYFFLGFFTSLMLVLWLFCLKREKELMRIQPLYYLNFVFAFFFDVHFLKKNHSFSVYLCCCFIIVSLSVYFFFTRYHRDDLKKSQ